jgi:uncharacterized membrane protein YbhN (UPF0104 family)
MHSAEAPKQTLAQEASDAQVAQRRSLRRRLLHLLFLACIAYLLLNVLPGLGEALRHLKGADPAWLLVAAGAEVLSEAGYALAWRSIVDPGEELAGVSGHLAAQVAWAQLAASMVNPVGLVGGIAASSVTTRRLGMGQEGMVQRQGVLFLLNTAVAVLAIVVVGTLMAVGVMPGSTNLLLTLLPAVLAGAAFVLVLVAARRARELKEGETPGRLTKAVMTVADSVDDTLAVLRGGGRALFGAFAYTGFEILVLWVAFLAVHVPTPAFAIVLMSYLVGAIGGSLPLPANLGAVGGIVAMFAAYGVESQGALAAVLVYQAIAMLVPLLGGGVAYLLLRRRLGPVTDKQVAETPAA